MPKSYRTCEIMQQLAYLTEEQIERGLDHNAIKDYAYILHDKDEDKDGQLKAPHWHICIRFKDSVPTASICSWFNISENYINKIKGRFADALAYLTHKNAPDKYQYLDEQVKSNFEFMREVETVSSRAIDRARREELIDLITSGIIREYNYTEYVTPQENDKFRQSIDKAFSYRKDMLEGSERDMKCIYIYGDSGSGKTTYAKELAEKYGYSYYVSSGSNDLLDSYKGQDCLILDDIRPNCIDVSDLLKLLDNHTSSTVRSRYRNKMLECKLVIVTTSVSMEVFFNGLLGDYNESIKQLRRRCELYIQMTMYTMTVYIYQPKSQRYEHVGTYTNEIAKRYKAEDRSKDDARQYVEGFLFSPTPATIEEKRANIGSFRQYNIKDLPFK